MQVIRTFIAIKVPEVIKDGILRLQDSLRNFPDQKVAWTKSEGIHLTLKFLGDVKDSEIDNIAEILEISIAEQESFTINTCRTGAFPNTSKPRILWLGVDGGENLHKLKNNIETGLSKSGFLSEVKRFNPHLTIGRVKFVQPGCEMLSAFKDYNQIEENWKVNKVHLFSSKLRPNCAVYSILHSIALK